MPSTVSSRRGRRRACVVDQDIDRVEALVQERRERADRGLTREIGRQKHGLSAGCQGSHPPVRRRPTGPVTRDHDDLGTAGRQLLGGRQADAAAGAGDENPRLRVGGHAVHDRPEARLERRYSPKLMISLADDCCYRAGSGPGVAGLCLGREDHPPQHLHQSVLLGGCQRFEELVSGAVKGASGSLLHRLALGSEVERV